jgi:serine O-acetyltransferase
MKIHLIISDGKHKFSLPLPDAAGFAESAVHGAKRFAGTVYGTVSDAVRPVKELYEAVRNEIRDDVAAVRQRDPAAKSDVEVLLLYSGVHAILAYRVAHRLYLGRRYFSARAISQLARHMTGIEIHPGATIGRGLFIDHGAGVVIGETSEIGDNCTLYQGVTLGGTGKDTGKRHPTLGDNVMIGAGAKVLGPFRIGDNSKIAAGAVVLNEIPENSTAVGIPAKVVCRNGVRVDPVKVIEEELDHVHVPDPVEQQICDMNDRISALSAEIEALKARKRKSSKADTSAE